MPVILVGWNDFYEGWLAGLFESGPPPPGATPGYVDGRNTAAEAQWDEQLRSALEGERELGHVVVTILPFDADLVTALAALRMPKGPERRRHREIGDEIEGRLRSELLSALDAYAEHVRMSS